MSQDAQCLEATPIESETTVVSRNQTQPATLTPAGLREQVNLIQQVMGEVMHSGEHYGTIPGCGDKPSLLKPGAEKLALTFRLAPEYEIRRTDMGGDHREYEVVCKLTHIPTGDVLGQGVGCCSTKEGKYRYRNAGLTCPACEKMDTIIKGKAEFGGGWLCFNRKGGCGAKFDDNDEAITKQPRGKIDHDNPADYYNCVAADTKILTRDLKWKRAGDIKDGELLIGVDEKATQYARQLATGKATVYGRKEEPLFEVTVEDGRKVRCNGEHKWLVKKVGLKGTEWVSTEEIYKEIMERRGRPRKWSIMSLCKPWRESKNKNAGYLAGLLDADGSLGVSQICVYFAQQDNIVLQKYKTEMEEFGFELGSHECKTEDALGKTKHGHQVYHIRVKGGFVEQMRALGTLRPPRLIERWNELIDLSKRRLEGRGSGAGKTVKIESVTRVGYGEIVLLGTSCKTYIAEGLVCHNTVLKMAKKRAQVDATLTATGASDIFAQDIEDMPEVVPGAASIAKDKGAPQPVAPAPAPTQAPPMPQAAAVLMTDEQKGQIDTAIGALTNTIEHRAQVVAWCNSIAGVASLDEMTEAQAATVIEKLNAQLN